MRSGLTRNGSTNLAKMSAPVPRPATLLLASASTARNWARGGVEAQALHQVEGATGVAQDLQRLDPRDVGEEPPAARVHEQRAALQLEEGHRPHLLGLARARAWRRRFSHSSRGRDGFKNRIDVPVARGPRIDEERCRPRFERAWPPHRAAGRARASAVCATLASTPLRARVAPAVVVPAPHAVRAAPRGPFAAGAGLRSRPPWSGGALRGTRRSS